ncbi:hypothetical protein [uncultured Tateyamaria sp.]|uniref:hypothetical protein n=1 Tax=Tateyamaria sp. 1078 TaxID=3417464 RepID=UPI0026119CEB|nr:hypothetical protein [uncultured Tateyamaria sp.]
MQILPLMGTAALLGAAGIAGWTALNQSTADIAIVGARVTGAETTVNPRLIDLTPNARNEAFYTAITDRPLFAETRRPFVAEAPALTPVEAEAEPEAPAPPPVLPPPEVRLLGVLSGGAREAALLSIAGGDPEWFDIGSDIDGWRLSDIAPAEIQLTQNERALRVELY